MRGLHASLLFLQGIPIFVGIFLAAWIAYYIRAAVVELRAIRHHLARLNGHFDGPQDTPPADKG